MRTRTFNAKVDRLESCFAEDQVQQGGVVCLNNEEEDFLEGNVEKFWPYNDMTRIAPDTGPDEIRVPWYGGKDCDLRR